MKDEMAPVPTLRTDRLILREHRPEDTEHLIRAYAIGGFAYHITRQKRALDRAEAWAAIALVAGSWPVSGYGQWIVEERASGQPVGRVGPWVPEGWPDFEIGWAIFPWSQGKGYAVEAAAAALVWAHEAFGRNHVIHLIDPLNTASERVAVALGAELTGVWDSPLCPGVRIWTTRWEDFVVTPAGRRALAGAGQECDPSVA
jgi:RimJ/RimL family protein N-acetyltransferase